MIHLLFQQATEPAARIQINGALGIGLVLTTIGILITWFWRHRNNVLEKEKADESRLKGVEVALASLETTLLTLGTTARLSAIEDKVQKMETAVAELASRLKPLLNVIDEAALRSIVRKDGG